MQSIQFKSKKIIKSESRFAEMLRFCIVGVFATGIHYGLYLWLVTILNTSVAYSIGYVISFVGNFFLSSYFTFKSKASLRKGIGFGFSHLVNYLFQMGLLNIFLLLGFSKQWVPIPVFMIVIPVNFILVRYFVKSPEKSITK